MKSQQLVSWKRAFLSVFIVLLLPFTFAAAPLDLPAAQTYQVTGLVHDNNWQPVSGARVYVVEQTSVSATSAADGTFTLTGVPAGDIHITTRTFGGCYIALPLAIKMTGNTSDVRVPVGTNYDAEGYYCQKETPAYVEAGSVVTLPQSDTIVPVTLPFAFPFYGQTYPTAYVSTNGFLSFQSSATGAPPVALPSRDAPNAVIAPFATEIVMGAGSSLRTQLLGSAPERKFVIEWRAVSLRASPSASLDFEVILWENGALQMQYRNISNTPYERGSNAVIGIENEDGTVGLEFSNDATNLRRPVEAIRFALNQMAVLSGVVTDANTGAPIQGALVLAYVEQIGLATGTVTRDDGSYYLPLDGRYHLAASAPGYLTTDPWITVDMRRPADDQTLNFALDTDVRAEISPAALDFDLMVGETDTQTLTLTNTGRGQVRWQTRVEEDWLTVEPASGTLDGGKKATLEVSVNASGLEPGDYSTNLVIQTNSTRTPELTVAVRLVVRQISFGVNVGGRAFTDANGGQWAADQGYRSGSWGYTNRSSTAIRTRAPIAGADEPRLFQSLRQNPGEYRFDNAPTDSYDITLYFAEYSSRRRGTRVFDVMIEGQTVLANHDITAEVGRFTADSHTFTVQVSDGQLNIRLVPRRGSAPPVLSGIFIIPSGD